MKDEIYDMRNDPEEAENLLQQRPSMVKRFGMTVDQFTSKYKPIHILREEPEKTKKGELAETMEKLKSLGYLK